MRYALTATLSELFGMDIQERGVNALLLCPFHNEDSPSFSIHLNEGMWQCFGCGKRGGLKKLYAELGETMTRDTYHDMLINSLRMTDAPKKNFASLAKKNQSMLRSQSAMREISHYLSSKPISEDAIYHFGIGWSKEKNAICIPYWDDGVVTGIKYRYKSGSKASETGSTFGMYGIDNIRGKKNVVICEGESDTHAMWSLLKDREDFGVAGISGGNHSQATWSLWAVDMMFAKNVYVALDADEVGDKGYLMAASIIGSEKCVRLRPTHGKDICEHIINGGNLAELGLEG
jgi:DNA primase